MKRRGFTLIELLVVIAIIALLLSVIVPSLGKAKEYAKRVMCMNAVRQTGLGLRFYADMYDDKLVPLFNFGEGGYYGESGITMPAPHQPVVAYDDAYTLPSTGAQPKYEAFHLGVLYDQGLIENPEIFYCPAQPRNSDYTLKYYYDAYTENGAYEWGTYIPTFINKSGGAHTYVRTSYNYWTYGKTRYDQIGIKPIVVDNLQEWEVIPHRKSRSIDSVPQGVAALFGDGHANFCTGPDIFADDVWDGMNSTDDVEFNGPGNFRETFEKIMYVLQGHQ